MHKLIVVGFAAVAVAFVAAFMLGWRGIIG